MGLYPIMSIIEDGQPEATASQNINVADSLTTEENPIDYWFIPNAMEDAGPAFNKGLYYNELYFEVKEGQDATFIGICKNQHVDGDWTIFDNFRLYYTAAVKKTVRTGVETSVKVQLQSYAQPITPSTVHKSANRHIVVSISVKTR